MLTLIVGNNDSELSTIAKQHSDSAYLVDFSNYTQQHSGTCYTSIADLPGLAEFASVLRQADTIIYHPPKKWTSAEMKNWTEKYLYTFSLDRSKNIINCPTFCVPKNSKLIFTLHDQRKSNNKCLWVSGASTSLGAGVEIHERYANILSEKLNLPLCMLSQSAVSIPYAVDQILRSDIRQDDIVVLGISHYSRHTYYDEENSEIIHVTPMNVKEQNRKIDLTDPTLLYDSITAVHQVLNFCRKIDAKIILLGIHPDLGFASYLKDIAGYVHANGFYGVNSEDRYIDLGSDNLHAGPLMHQWYAEKILNKLKEIK